MLTSWTVLWVCHSPPPPPPASPTQTKCLPGWLGTLEGTLNCPSPAATAEAGLWTETEQQTLHETQQHRSRHRQTRFQRLRVSGRPGAAVTAGCHARERVNRSVHLFYALFFIILFTKLSWVKGPPRTAITSNTMSWSRTSMHSKH